MNPIAEFVKMRRKEAGLTQKEFAMRLGLGLRLPALSHPKSLPRGKANPNSFSLELVVLCLNS